MSATIPALGLLAFLYRRPHRRGADDSGNGQVRPEGVCRRRAWMRASRAAFRRSPIGSCGWRSKAAAETSRSKKIVRIERPDTVKNGALIGLASARHGPDRHGFRPAGRWRAGQPHAGERSDLRRDRRIDRRGQDRRRTLYERGPRPQARLHPVIGRHVRGVAATVEW